MNPVRSRLSAAAVGVILSLVIPALGQIPDVPPPTMDREGTERSWDITHPGWREWNNDADDADDSQDSAESPSNQSPSDPSAQFLQSVVEERKREQEKKQQEERLQQLQAIWQEQGRQQQQAQQQQQAEQQKQIFERAKQLLLASLQTPSEASMPAVQGPIIDAVTRPYVTSFGSAAVSLPGSHAGLSAGEWRQVRQYQDFIDTLSRSAEATPEDRTVQDIAEVRRNQLWSKAVSVPALPDDTREAMALSLPVVTPPDCPRLTFQDAQALQKSMQSAPPQDDAAATVMLSDLYVNAGTEGAGMLGEATIKRLLNEDAADRFGDFLGVSKIALATAQDGASSGMAATADFLIGKIPLPQSTVAVAGGRQYANVAYQVQSKFMVDAMKVTGADFDVQEFWRNFKEELGAGQKAVMEFVSYGPQN